MYRNRQPLTRTEKFFRWVKWNGPFLWGIGMIVSIVILVGLCLYFLPKAGCEARWSQSGRNWQWSFVGGCLVENSKGQLVPEGVIRNIEVD